MNLRKKVVRLTVVLMIYAMTATIAGCVGGGGHSVQEKKEAGSELKTFPVRVKYTDGDKVIPNAEVYFFYCDETSALVDKTANTGDGETVTFNVPLNEDGSSFPFIILLSKEEIAKAKEAHTSGSLRMYRRPAGETCEYLEFQIQKEGGGTNQGCSIQIWSCGKK